MISQSLGVWGFLSVWALNTLGLQRALVTNFLLSLLTLITASKGLEAGPQRWSHVWLWILFSLCRVWVELFQNHSVWIVRLRRGHPVSGKALLGGSLVQALAFRRMDQVT